MNTYVWVNRDSYRRFVKFHWKTMQGIETISHVEAEHYAGSDSDIAVNRLHDAIAKGKYPKHELCVQLMTPEEAEKLPFDPLDDTKTWSEDVSPLKKVGVLTLNRNRKAFLLTLSKPHFVQRISSPELSFPQTKCFRDVHFPITTHIGTV